MKGDDHMANLRGKMKKLQTALVKNGLIVKINQNQFYSEDQKRMITSYQIALLVDTYDPDQNEWKKKNYEILKSCSMVDIIMCLLEMYKAVSG